MSIYYPEKRIPVAVLGATGSVGQRFVQLLDSHPWFELVAITGSERTVGNKYGEACHWVLPEKMPTRVKDLIVLPSKTDIISTPIVFSALPSKYAAVIEPAFAKAGVYVFSNAGAFRTEKDVPILLPEVNPSHLDLIDSQRAARGWTGAIVTNPNCTSTGLAIVLKALMNAFGLKKSFVVSLQAISGAGYPGVSSFDMIDNVIPYIEGEEQKLEWEPRKILGTYNSSEIKDANFKISAHCNRVAVSDGHMICLSVELENPPQRHELATSIKKALQGYKAPQGVDELPFAPRPVINVVNEKDRPQPRLDRYIGNGMTTSVGRIREDTLLHAKMTILSHNTIRGAAGGSILNAELFVSKGYLP